MREKPQTDNDYHRLLNNTEDLKKWECTVLLLMKTKCPSQKHTHIYKVNKNLCVRQ